jgi:hypothetical protein
MIVFFVEEEEGFGVVDVVLRSGRRWTRERERACYDDDDVFQVLG